MISNLHLTEESFESLELCRNNAGNYLHWYLIFTLPAWLKAWWEAFGDGADLFLRAVQEGTTVIGVAPLQIRQATASIIGSVNVCDYQDFIVVPGKEPEFFETLLDNLIIQGVETLDLRPLRPGSAIITHLIPLAKQRGFAVSLEKDEFSLEMALPGSFDDYLKLLDRKQRHEVRRKIRNLEQAGNLVYRVVAEKSALINALDYFLKLFIEARTDKASFMTPRMESFFRSLVDLTSDTGITRFGVLELEGHIIAMVLYFDYNNNIYLYNSGFSPAFRELSAGIVCKVLSVRDSIQKGRVIYDFMKGNETYKFYLGGREVSLYNCRIRLQS